MVAPRPRASPLLLQRAALSAVRRGVGGHQAGPALGAVAAGGVARAPLRPRGGHAVNNWKNDVLSQFFKIKKVLSALSK